MRYIAIACLVIFTAFACHALWDIDKFVPDLPATNGKLDATLADLDSAIGVFHDAEQKQADFYDPKKPGGATQQIQRTIVDLKTFIGHTDDSLNGRDRTPGLLGIAGNALNQTISLSKTTASDLDDTSKQLQPILADLGTGAAAFAKQTPIILQGLDDNSSQIGLILKNSTSATAHVDATTKDVQDVADAFRNDYLKPRNRLYFYFKELLGIASGVGNAARY